MTTAKTHCLTRTSPMGGPFLGMCIQCGIENLSGAAANQPCSNPRQLSSDDALIEVIDGPDR